MVVGLSRAQINWGKPIVLSNQQSSNQSTKYNVRVVSIQCFFFFLKKKQVQKYIQANTQRVTPPKTQQCTAPNTHALSLPAWGLLPLLFLLHSQLGTSSKPLVNWSCTTHVFAELARGWTGDPQWACVCLTVYFQEEISLTSLMGPCWLCWLIWLFWLC